jgi:hypothetical protein
MTGLGQHRRLTYISPRRWNQTMARIAHAIGNAIPSSRNDACPLMAFVRTLKFIPKKPVRKVMGRKIIETIVSRSICSPCR